VLQSIENCVIFDLETHVRLEDLTDASYTGLIRKYFGLTSEYSHRVEEKITRFQQLSEKPELTDEEADSFIELDAYFRQMSPLLSPELYQHYQQALTKAKQGFLKKDC
jgi:hypothetical protein